MALSKKAKWIIGITAGVLVGLPILIVLIVILFLGTIVEKGFEVAGPQLLGVETRLDDANIKIFRGDVALKGLFVGNPEGFTNPTFMKADTIKVGADIGSLMSDEIHVREVILDGPEFTFEYKTGGSNVSKILERLESEEKKAEETKEQKKLRIDLIRITNAKITVVLAGQDIKISLPQVELTDIGNSDDGASPATVLKEILAGITKPAEDLIRLSEVGDAFKKLGGNVMENGKKILGGGSETIKDVGKDLGGAVKETGKGIKKLFGE